MKKWLFRLLILAVVVVLIILFYRFYTCRQKGKESGKAYQCGFFSLEPTFLFPEKIYRTARHGKCYEVTDYGKRMSFREIEKENCAEVTE